MIKPKIGIALFFACALPLMMANCKPPQQALVGAKSNVQGIAKLKILAQANSPFKQIARTADIIVSANDMQTMTDTLLVTDSSVEGEVTGIPSGKNRCFQVNVFDSAKTKRYSGSAIADVIGDSTVLINISVNRIDGNAIINGSINENWPDTQPTANSVTGPTAYWSFDSMAGQTFYDVTGHGYNAIATGSGTSIVPGVVGNALSCPDSGFEITVANSKDSFAFKKFTVESWYFANSIPTGGQARILTFDYAASGIRNGWALCVFPQGFPDFTLSSGDGTEWIDCLCPIAILPGKWYHIVGSFDGSNLRLYVNGVLENTVSYSGGVLAPGTNARIACQRLMDGTVRYGANGKIDELKVYNYALSASRILADFNAINLNSVNKDTSINLTSGLMAYYPFNGNAADESDHGLNGVVNGATLTTDRFGNPNKAYSFNGINSGISVQVNSQFSLTKFTLSGWIKSIGPGAYLPRIVAVGSAGIATHYYSLLYDNGVWDHAPVSSNRLIFFNGNTLNPFSYAMQYSHDSIGVNVWHHGAVSYDGGRLRFYIDGKLDKDTIIIEPIQQFTGSAVLQIGYSEGGDQFQGSLDEIRIYNRALNDNEINALYLYAQ
jgi:hypothetical protein